MLISKTNIVVMCITAILALSGALVLTADDSAADMTAYESGDVSFLLVNDNQVTMGTQYERTINSSFMEYGQTVETDLAVDDDMDFCGGFNDGRIHLAGNKALPDQLVETILVSAEQFL